MRLALECTHECTALQCNYQHSSGIVEEDRKPTNEPEVRISPYRSVQHGRSRIIHGLVIGPSRRPADLVIRNREASNVLTSYIELLSCFEVEHALHVPTKPDSTRNTITLHLHFSSKVLELKVGTATSSPNNYVLPTQSGKTRPKLNRCTEVLLYILASQDFYHK